MQRTLNEFYRSCLTHLPLLCSCQQPVLLLLQEIVDETDRYVDREQMQRVNAGKLVRSLPPRLRK